MARAKTIEVELPDGLDQQAPDTQDGAASAEADSYMDAKADALMKRAERGRRQDPLELARWLIRFERESVDDKTLPKTLLKFGREAARLFVPEIPRDMMPGYLRAAHAEVRAGFEAWRVGQPWIFQPSAPPKAILLPPKPGLTSEGAVLSWRPVSGQIDRFIVRAMAVLDAAGTRLRRCRTHQCPEFFVATKRQVWCGRHAMERQKARLVEVTKRRRKERERLREAKAQSQAR